MQQASQLPDVHTSSKKTEQDKDDRVKELEKKKKDIEHTETYVDVEIDEDGNMITSNPDIQVYVPANDKQQDKPKTAVETQEPMEISDDEVKTTLTRKLPTFKQIEKYKVMVTFKVDTSKLPPPIPEGEQDPDYHYYTMCNKKFTHERHLQAHITELCDYLTEKTKIKCPHCDKTFSHAKNFRNHLSSKHKYEKHF